MYCEKCGKMNPDGAMFCSNCSSILRSRRSSAPAAKPAEPTHKEDDATRRIPVTNTVKHESQPLKTAFPEREERYTAPKNTYPTTRAAAVSEPSRKRPSYYDDYDDEDEGPHIVRVKRFSMKPMSVEEAMLQLELLGHSFFVFTNAETDRINVIYARKDGNFGLIEPDR